jgi:cytochrome P450
MPTSEAPTRRVQSLPPGPPLPFPLWGLGAGLLFEAGQHFLHRRYGGMFTLRFPPGAGLFTPEGSPTPRAAVVISEPELIKQVFAGMPEELHFGEESPLGRIIGMKSLFGLDEAEHIEQRKLLLPPFHGKRMHAYEAIVEEETLRETESWPEGQELRTQDSTMRITLNVILRAVFGAESGELDELREEMPRAVVLGSRLVALTAPLQRELGGRGPFGEFMRLRRRFEWAVNALIDKARHDPELEQRADVLALLAQATHEDGSPMTDEEIRDHLSAILAAGHETTATTLAWAVERLRRHPRLLRRLAEEADGDGDALRTATIYEVQRTRPVIPGTGRIVMKPFEVGEYVLPPGTVILLSAELVHNDPRHYPNPRAFDPDRFVGRKPSTTAWIPFGGGRRRCIGAAFAHMEMNLVLRTLLRNFELVPTTAPGERKFFRGVAFAPSGGGRAVVHRRVRSRPQAPALAEAA